MDWTADGQLASVTGSKGATSYVYDADGNLLLQENPGSTTLYLPDEQLTATTSSGTITVTGDRIIPLPSGGDVVRTGATTSYYFEIPDQQGTNELSLNDTAQTPTWRQFTPYGAPRGTTATWIDNRGFLNQPTDPDTGLTYGGARDYDTATAQFISPDPILTPSDPQDLNPYDYAEDNPVTSSDPTGAYVIEGGGGGGSSCNSTCLSNLTHGGDGSGSGSDGSGSGGFGGGYGSGSSAPGGSGGGYGSGSSAPGGSGGGSTDDTEPGCNVGISARDGNCTVDMPADEDAAPGGWQSFGGGAVDGLLGLSCAGSAGLCQLLGLVGLSPTQLWENWLKSKHVDTSLGSTYGIGVLTVSAAAALFGGEESAAEDATTSLAPTQVRLSQASVNGAAKIIDSMRANGWVGDPIDVVQMPDGGLTTMDNTRVVAANQAGINVQATIHGFDEPLPSDQDFIDCFTTVKGGVPSTYGEGVLALP